ncbi:MAG TPA: dTDP-4-dehydrorhamnose 3,5-epimerase [Pyrinomonadaceae bacterium]|nr:dTDP-4-dehydrorhamnose 3,5-epimerase [Pyrinomonadaceae bacterium]
MIAKQTKLNGAYIIEPERFEDERGFFARAWSAKELTALGAVGNFVEANFAYNHKRGTLRGLHWQAAPHEQAKLVRCTRGSIFDVAVDLRPESETYGQWTSVELSAANRLLFYVPDGFAHGYLTLEDDSEVLYLVTSDFAPASSRGARWNDPALGIRWPDVGELIINERDNSYPDFQL